MAKWERGESGNPSGRPKLPEEARELRKLTIEQVTTVFTKYLGMTLSEMSALNKEELSLLELWIIKAAETGMRSGNYLMLDKILDRVIGKTLKGQSPVGQSPQSPVGHSSVGQSPQRQSPQSPLGISDGSKAPGVNDPRDTVPEGKALKAPGNTVPWDEVPGDGVPGYDELKGDRELDKCGVGIDFKGIVLKDFEKCCELCGYGKPYKKQVEMAEFIFGEAAEPRMVLGARKYGKTDYCVIVKSAQMIAMRGVTIILVTKEQSRAREIAVEIGRCLERLGVREFLRKSSEIIVIKGNEGKEPNLKAISMSSSGFRGRHPGYILLDDPVTPEASSRADRERAKKVYDELLKMTQRVRILGQPVHKKDLYELTRRKINTMEVPYGTIPELDIDLEVLRLAGVDEASIRASYFLKIESASSMPFAGIEMTEARIEVGEGTMCSIDPSHEGGDYTAITIARAHIERILVVGFCYKSAWYDCLDEIGEIIKRYNVKVGYFENNALGQEPVRQLNGLNLGCRFEGFKSLDNKEAKIQNAGMYVNTLILSKESNAEYIRQITDYEVGAGNDDAPDSLANWLINSGWMKAAREKRWG